MSDEWNESSKGNDSRSRETHFVLDQNTVMVVDVWQMQLEGRQGERRFDLSYVFLRPS